VESCRDKNPIAGRRLEGVAVATPHGSLDYQSPAASAVR